MLNKTKQPTNTTILHRFLIMQATVGKNLDDLELIVFPFVSIPFNSFYLFRMFELGGQLRDIDRERISSADKNYLENFDKIFEHLYSEIIARERKWRYLWTCENDCQVILNYKSKIQHSIYILHYHRWGQRRIFLNDILETSNFGCLLGGQLVAEGLDDFSLCILQYF